VTKPKSTKKAEVVTEDVEEIISSDESEDVETE
jgi:hypothetical protein